MIIEFLMMNISLKTLLETLSTIGVLAAALFAWRSAIQSKKATQAALLSSILDRYAERDMHKAMNNWKDFACSNLTDHVRKFEEIKEYDKKKYDKLDSDRRLISHHMMKIARLHREKFINKRHVQMVAARDKVEFWKYIIEPIEARIYPGIWSHTDFKTLQKIYGIHHTATKDEIRKYLNTNCSHQ